MDSSSRDHAQTDSERTPQEAPSPDTLLDQVNSLGVVGSWAPGSYRKKCRTCERLFEGDKRAGACPPCAVENLQRIVARAFDGPGLDRLFLRLIEEQSAGEWDMQTIIADTARFMKGYKAFMAGDGASSASTTDAGQVPGMPANPVSINSQRG